MAAAPYTGDSVDPKGHHPGIEGHKRAVPVNGVASLELAATNDKVAVAVSAKRT